MSILTKMAIVAVGGALGALGRTGLGAAVVAAVGTTTVGAAAGTMAANILGCLGMGCAKAAVEVAGWGGPKLNALVFSGFLGAFTTFSTFEANTMELWSEGRRALAGLYMGGSVVGGLVAFLFGWWMVETWVG